MNQKERTKKRNLDFKYARTLLSARLGDRMHSCEMCGKEASEDHHIIKKAEDNYLYNSDVNNLIRVCRSCHVLFHSYESDKLFKINSDRFLEVMHWLGKNGKETTIYNFDKKLT